MSINSLNIETVLLSIICLSFGAHIITAIQFEIENHPGVTTDNCGKGYITDEVDDHCFEWNHFDDPESSFVNGRPALPAEVPFVVPIIVWGREWVGMEWVIINECIGTIINANWVITSKDCLTHPWMKDREYLIYPGMKDFNETHDLATNYRTTRYYESIALGYAAALLKFETPMLSNTLSINSICLPKKPVESKYVEHYIALITGRAYFEDKNLGGPDEERGGEKTIKSRLRYSPGKVKKSSNIYVGWARFTVITGFWDMGFQPIPFGGYHGCVGMSGSPVIQYVNKRAVLIAINLKSDDDFADCALNFTGWNLTTKGSNIFHRISDMKDDIIKIIKSK